MTIGMLVMTVFPCHRIFPLRFCSKTPLISLNRLNPLRSQSTKNLLLRRLRNNRTTRRHLLRTSSSEHPPLRSYRLCRR